jgi:outer membrane protein TolC
MTLFCYRLSFPFVVAVAAICLFPACVWAQGNPTAPDPSEWMNHPLTLKECVDLALQNNGEILRAKHELEADYGISMQIRSLALPTLKVAGDFIGYNAKNVQALELNVPAATNRWSGSIRLIQSVYEGGRMVSAVKAAALTKQQALLRYKAIVSGKILDVRTGYFDLLLAESEAGVQKAAFELQGKEHEDIERRLGTGLVAHFDMLRSEVALASARPKLIRAQNQLKISKAKFVELLGFNIPADVWDNVPLQLADPLEAEPYEIGLPAAIERALNNRPEIQGQEKEVALQREKVTNARSGFLPSLQVTAGYGGFNDDLDRDIHGWFAGADAHWYLFDGLETQGKIKEAHARLSAAEVGLSDLKRSVGLEVRLAYSSFTEAKEVLDAQTKAQELAEESLRQTRSHLKAGELTQLDLMASETTLAEVKSDMLRALRDYDVAVASMERAIGLPTETK